MSANREDNDIGTFTVGISLPATILDAAASLRKAQQDGFSFVTTATESPLPRSDVLALRAAWWRTSVVGCMEDAVAMRGLDFCQHMQLPAVILPELTAQTNDIHRIAAKVASSLATSGSVHFWVPVPLSTQGLEHWQLFHRLTGYHRNVSILLTLQPLPTGLEITSLAEFVAQQLPLLHVFLGEPISAVTLSTDLFLTNKKGYPTLSKSHQVIFTQLFVRIGRTIKVLLTGPPRHFVTENAKLQGATGCLPYLQYLQHLRQQPSVVLACDSTEAKVETDYLDSLQRPLQPLADHLEYEIYENFEKDPVKYSKYRDAIHMTLSDLTQLQKRQEVTVYVVGAGRGPLVTAVLEAYEMPDVLVAAAACRLNVVVVEKNPSAVLILQSRAQQDTQWQRYRDSIKIIHSDLRNLTLEGCGGYVADVVVSELLGSFGDNELSPECLDSFYKTSVCRPDTISIPTRYTSYLSLVSSAKLHSQAKQQALYPNDYDSGVQGLLKAMETPYVVRTHACSQMSEEKECWTFTHPSPTPTLEHHREIILNMESKEIADYRYGNGYGPVTATLDMAVQSTTPDVAWTCTGLLGTFSADLYTSQQGRGTPQISIAPANFSMGMFSWFPLYFPISEPLLIPPGAVARVYLWRRQSLDHAKVWYEWSVAVHRDGQLLAATPIHNPGGRSYYVSMK